MSILGAVPQLIDVKVVKVENMIEVDGHSFRLSDVRVVGALCGWDPLLDPGNDNHYSFNVYLAGDVKIKLDGKSNRAYLLDKMESYDKRLQLSGRDQCQCSNC